MKKIIFAAALFLMSLCFGENMSAGNFGVVGGANFHTSGIKEIGTQTLTQWHAGIAYKFNLPLGFKIQPTLLYNVKPATSNVTDLDFSMGLVELHAAVQWGVDLILFRPYLEVSPYAGYAVSGLEDLKGVLHNTDRLEYGVGLGGGLQIWRFQVSARYNWNVYDMLQAKSTKDLLENSDFNGVSLSLAYFF